MSHVVHAEGRDFRARYRLIVGAPCEIDGFSASSVSELYKYDDSTSTAGLDNAYAICKGPDGFPWAAIIERISIHGHRGPFVYRWDGAAWNQESCAATTDGGIGTEQTQGSYRAEWLGVLNVGFGPIGGLNNDPNVWGNVSYGGANTGSYHGGSYGASVDTFSESNPVTAYIACDDTNIYSLWHHATYWRYEYHSGGDVFYAPLYARQLLRVRMFDGATWTELGSGLTHWADQSNSDAFKRVGAAARGLCADPTGVYVWYVDSDLNDASTIKHYVVHWDGGVWNELGGGDIAAFAGNNLFGSGAAMQVDGSGTPTLVMPASELGGADDEVVAATFDGANWQTDTYQVAYPNYDIPAGGFTLTVNAVTLSPIRPDGTYVVGFQCNRDAYENYFATYDPSTQTWATFRDGAKLVGLSASQGIHTMRLVAPEGDKLWLATTSYFQNGPEFWVYSPACNAWQPAGFEVGVDLPYVANWATPYRDGAHLYVIESEVVDGGVREEIWDGTISHGLAPSTILPALSPPPNDDFADALVITGASGQASAIDINRATLEPGEPQGSCLVFGPIAQTVWFKWTAPGNGNVTFDTQSSRDASGWIIPDTTLTAWTGTNFGDLVQVACDDDSGVGLSSQMTFAATGGVDYYIQVGMAYEGGACDRLVLAWS